MSKFENEDKIVYKKHTCDVDIVHFEIGKVYTIARGLNLFGSFVLYLKEAGTRDDQSAVHVHKEQIEKVIKNTKLARKLYPNHRVINEEWIIPRR